MLTLIQWTSLLRVRATSSGEPATASSRQPMAAEWSSAPGGEGRGGEGRERKGRKKES